MRRLHLLDGLAHLGLLRFRQLLIQSDGQQHVGDHLGLLLIQSLGIVLDLAEAEGILGKAGVPPLQLLDATLLCLHFRLFLLHLIGQLFDALILRCQLLLHSLPRLRYVTGRTLQQLQLSGTELYSIDLGYNRNLKQLKLNGNHFFALNIRGVNDAYQKTLLTDIDLSDNELREVTLNDMGTIHNLNLSDNQLTELSLKDADNMRSLDLSGNRLTTVNLSYCTLMTDCDLSNNLITEIAMPA